jgi:protoporphyrinogen oxidase
MNYYLKGSQIMSSSSPKNNPVKSGKPIAIVGAGVTGCIAGYELARSGYPVVLIEKEKMAGGLARTFRYGELSFDIGPHRFYAFQKNIHDYIVATLGTDALSISRRSAIYFRGAYHSWPLQPELFLRLPLSTSLRALLDLAMIAFRRNSSTVHNFEEYVLQNYGETLYRTFFLEYTRKFTGMHPKEVHYDWARHSIKRAIIDGGIDCRNLIDVLHMILYARHIQNEFIYPRQGVSSFCNSLVQKITALGGEVLVDKKIDSLRFSSGRINGISFNGGFIEPETVVWTGSLKDISSLLNTGDTGLEYLSLVIFNVEVNSPVQKDYQWSYYGNDEVFSRVSVPALFDRDMAGQGKHGLCAEVTCRQGDGFWARPEAMTSQVIKDLVKVGLIKKASDVGAVHIEKIANTYPVYSLEYQDRLQEAKKNLGVFNNLILAGRTGLFWYNNMDDSIANGLEVARQLISRHEA